MVSFTNLARALGMFTFEGRDTSSFAACIIIAIQYTLAESSACFIQTSIQVIVIRVVLKYEFITIINVSDLHYRSKLGCHILGIHQCNQYDMDKLNKRNKSITLQQWIFKNVLTVTTNSPSAITFHETIRVATGRDTLHIIVVAF